MKQYIVDAFADELFTGNPAAVVPCMKLPAPEFMQKIAIENNYSETAFVMKKSRGQYDLKWYTPGGEIDLCGHATLAAAFVLHKFEDKGVHEMHFHTLSGKLTVTAGKDGYTMDFPAGRTKPIPVTDAIREATNGLAREAHYDGGDLVVIVDNEMELRNFVPDGEQIRKLDGLGLVMTVQSEHCDFVSRCFYPKLNVLEDPVTGRAHTYTAPIWTKRIGKEVLFAKQLSKRGGAMTVQCKGNRVYLTGKVQLFMEGNLSLEG